MTPQATQLTLGTQLLNATTRAYGLAHFGKSLFWYASELLMAYFLTEISQIPPKFMGFILAAGLLTGAIADLIYGSILKKWLSETHMAARLQLLGAVLSALMIMALFLGALLPDSIKLVYALATGLLFRCAYALYDLPQNAILSLSTQDLESRTRIASLRLFFSGVAAVILSASVGPLLVSNDGLGAAFRYPVLSLGLSIIAVFSAYGLYLRLGKNLPESPALTGKNLKDPLSVKSPSRLSPDIWLLILIMFLVSGTVSSFSKIEPYYASYVLKSAFWGGSVIISAALGLTLSQPAWASLAMHMSRLKIFCLCAALLILSAIAFYVLGTHPVWGVGLAFSFGTSNGGLGMVLWAAFGDRVAKQAKGQEGLAFGLFTASSKLSLSLAGLALGQALAVFDYQKTQSMHLLVLMTLPTILGVSFALILIAVWSRLRPFSPKTETSGRF